jgi:hypothetical protein
VILNCLRAFKIIPIFQSRGRYLIPNIWSCSTKYYFVFLTIYKVVINLYIIKIFETWYNYLSCVFCKLTTRKITPNKLNHTQIFYLRIIYFFTYGHNRYHKSQKKYLKLNSHTKIVKHI